MKVLLAPLLAACCMACCIGSAPAWADSPSVTSTVPSLNQEEALRLSQARIGEGIGEHSLKDRQGRNVDLASYRGQPLLVSFIYTGCFQVCPASTRTLHKAVAAAQEALGAGRFKIVSIGFNQPADSPGALKYFATQNGIRDPDWEFLSPAAATVPQLARDFGFSYVETPAGFDHILQVTVVDGQGKIYRQIYGDAFSADQLLVPLKQLIAGAPVAETGTLAELVERVRVLCSIYDPATGKYRVSYGLIFEIAGGITFILWILGLFASEWWNRRKLRRQLSV